MSFPRYKQYKDSGIVWLGKIPSHWKIIRLKNVLKQKITDGPHLTPTFTNEGIPFLSVDGIQNGELVFESCRYISQQDHSEFRKKALPIRNDLLMGKAASTGKIARVKVDHEFSIWSPLALIRVDKLRSVPEFIEYVLKSPLTQAEIDTFCTVNTQKNISMDDIPRLTISSPPLDEQKLIVKFLDKETSKIDKLVAEQEKLIELLKEKRQAVISHAVTKGVDLKVKMKDSGLEWLGEVPENWNVQRIRRFVKLNPSKSEIGELDKKTEVSFLPMEAIGEEGALSLEMTKPLSEVESGYTYFREGDVTIAKITPCFENGKGAVMKGLHNGFGFGTTELIVARPIDGKVTSDFLYRLFSSTHFRKNAEGSMYGAGGQKRVPDEFIREFQAGLPPISDQIKITEFLDYETAKFESLIKEAMSVISLLNERRSALISAAVTGQIDVRNYQPKEPT